MSSGQSGQRLESEFDRIARGGLATSTQKRLRELTGWGGFSSFLSAPEFSVGEAIGVHPVAQLVGLAGGEVMSGYVRIADSWRRPLNVEGVVADPASLAGARWNEHPQMTRSLNELRRRALRRLSAQAEQLGCQAVAGVVARRVVERHGEGERLEAMFEFRGTGVRIDGWTRRPRPVLTLLGVRELSLLLGAGIEPAGIVGGVGRVELRPAQTTIDSSRSFGFALPNRELGDLTQSVYEARHAALKTLQAEAADLKASGVLDLRLELEHHGHPTQTTGSVIFTAFALAAAVRRVGKGTEGPVVGPVLGLGSGA